MKISKTVLGCIVELQEAMAHCANRAAQIKAGDPSLPSAVLERSADYYYGLVDGYHTSIEMLLMSHNAYRGFRTVSTKHGGEHNQYFTSHLTKQEQAA
jgi:hypothetical protein